MTMPATTVDRDAGWALIARFPLGTYRGHLPDGTPEHLPSFRRAFDALTAAAALGSEGVNDPVVGRTLSDESRHCLSWLAAHPPSAVHIPPTATCPVPPGIAWRKEGVFLKEGKHASYKVTSRTLQPGTAVNGVVAWWWDHMPEPIREQLARIAADVPCLGETDSVVILELGQDVTPTHHLDDSATVFRPRGTRVDVPTPDRLSVLEERHRLAYPKKRPSAARDRHNTSSLPAPVVTPDHSAAMPLFFVEDSATTSATPWPSVMLVPVRCRTRRPADNELVAVTTLVHRTLVQRISAASPSGEVPASITGRYLDGGDKPANHLAIHWIPRGAPLAGDREHDHIALLLPQEAYDEVLTALASGLDGLHRFTSQRHRLEALTQQAHLVAAEDFWAPTPPGTQRWWRPAPVAIPERTFKIPHADEGAHAELAMYWSLGNVFRNDPELADSDPILRRRGLESQGVRVAAAAPVLTKRPLDYVHRTNLHALVRPYRALVDLGSLVPPTTAIAVGQSRHLGGGILTPVDLPLPTPAPRSQEGGS